MSGVDHTPVRAASPARWILACAAAESLGLAASAGAARAADTVLAREDGSGTTAVALAVIVAGGLVEGSALGWAQGTVLRERLPALRRGRYVLVTLAVAGVGWAAASAPAVLSQDDGHGATPPLSLMLLGAAGIGLVMGPVLGGAQAITMRGAAERLAPWVVVNTLAWPPAMVVIFWGASRPDAAWPVTGLVALGAVTGAVAGTVVGVGTGRFLPSPPLQLAGRVERAGGPAAVGGPRRREE